jgi:hypothetical protein
VAPGAAAAAGAAGRRGNDGRPHAACGEDATMTFDEFVIAGLLAGAALTAGIAIGLADY